MLCDCRDIGGFLEVAFFWIHPIHQNLCRTQWPRVGDNIYYRNNRFVYGYVTLTPLKVILRENFIITNILIFSFIMKLSTILCDWLMTSCCLHKVKKVYVESYVSEEESN